MLALLRRVASFGTTVQTSYAILRSIASARAKNILNYRASRKSGKIWAHANFFASLPSNRRASTLREETPEINLNGLPHLGFSVLYLARWSAVFLKDGTTWQDQRTGFSLGQDFFALIQVLESSTLAGKWRAIWPRRLVPEPETPSVAPTPLQRGNAVKRPASSLQLLTGQLPS